MLASQVLVTQAQIQAMHVTAVQLVGAPGAGRMLVPMMIALSKPTAVAYTGGGPVMVYIGPLANDIRYGNTTGVLGLDQATPGAGLSLLYDETNSYGSAAQMANQPLNLSNQTAAFAGAGGDCIVTVFYSIAAI